MVDWIRLEWLCFVFFSTDLFCTTANSSQNRHLWSTRRVEWGILKLKKGIEKCCESNLIFVNQKWEQLWWASLVLHTDPHQPPPRNSPLTSPGDESVNKHAQLTTFNCHMVMCFRDYRGYRGKAKQTCIILIRYLHILKLQKTIPKEDTVQQCCQIPE